MSVPLTLLICTNLPLIGSTKMRHETRAVLASVYFRRQAPMYTHVVEIDDNGRESRVLCSRVKLTSIADSGATDPTAEATCATCSKRDPRMRVVDFSIGGGGTVYTVTARSGRAKLRLEEIVVENDVPQYLRLGNHTIAVEHRYIGQWVENLQSEGWEVR